MFFTLLPLPSQNIREVNKEWWTRRSYSPSFPVLQNLHFTLKSYDTGNLILFCFVFWSSFYGADVHTCVYMCLFLDSYKFLYVSNREGSVFYG